MKKLYSILLLILWPAVAWGDTRSFEIPGTNPVLVQGVQGHPLMVPLEVNIAASAAVTVVQGASGVDADPWNAILRDSSGVELGLAASPFGVSIYDAASNLLGVTANPFVVDVAALPSVMSADSNNTTTTPLGIGAVFTGTATDLLTNGNPHVLVTVFADEDSAASGLVLQFSQDGTNWEAGSTKHTFTLDADEERTFQFGPEARYFRAVLTNGGTAQTAFRLTTMLKRNIGYTTMHRVGDAITADRSVIGISKSLNMLQKPDLSFTNQKATSGGIAKTAISEFEVALPSGTNLLGKIGAESPHSALDLAEATTGWTVLGDAANIATSTTHIEGTLALEWDKAGGTEVTSGMQKTIDVEQTPGHATDVLLHCMLYIKDGTDLATVDFGFMRVGEDASNYLEFQVDGVDMAVGWNHKNFTLTSPTSQVGDGLSTGIIKYMAFGVATNNAADTFTNMLGDDFHYDETLSAAVVSAPSSDVQLGSVVLQDRNSNTKADVETDGSKKALHVMSNSMASESTLSDLEAKAPAQGQAAMTASVPVVLASDHSDILVEGAIVDGETATGRGIFPMGIRDGNSFFYLSGRNRLLSMLASQSMSDGFSNSSFGVMQTTTSQAPQFVGNLYYNGTTHDRMRGNTSGLFAQGPIADGATAGGNPIQMAGKSSAGNVETFAVSPNGEIAMVNKVTGADGFANTRLGQLFARTGESQVLQVAPSLFNETSHDMTRGNTDITVLASAARTATTNSADFTNYNGRGVQVIIDVTVDGAGASVVFAVEMKDPVSGDYVPILTSAAVDATGERKLTVYPGATESANLISGQPMPRTWRVSATHADGDSITYSVGASVIL